MFDGLVGIIIIGWIINFILLCSALYFFFSNNYGYLSLFVTFIIFISAIIYCSVKPSDRSVMESISLFSFPVGFFSGIFEFGFVTDYLFFLIGLSVNFLSLFAVVNLIYIILRTAFNG